MSVQSTTDYSIFKRIPGNRDIKKQHVAKLTTKILRENLLEEYPIIVNEEMGVIDGQHRLEVAKANNMVIFYKVKPGTTLKTVQSINSSSLPWRTTDFLETWIEFKNPNYVEVKEFMKKTGWSLALSAGLLAINKKGQAGLFRGARTDFREGLFEVGDKELAERVWGIAEALKPYYENRVIYHDRELVRALIKLDNLMEEGIVSWDRLVTKFIESGWTIKRQIGTRDYLRTIEEIYNYKVKTPLRFF